MKCNSTKLAEHLLVHTDVWFVGLVFPISNATKLI